MLTPTPFRTCVLGSLLVAAMAPGSARATATTPPVDSLLKLSLEELTQIDVTIASRGAERLERTAAAVSVITSDQIRRSGATSIPEALRLVPGVVVARIGSNQWAVNCRFPDGRFSNKLLVLVDGRTVYNPIFSGTYWDAQDTMLADVDRIEVIRGSGAAPWGSNAVAGVIHVITRNAKETTRDFASVSGGDDLQFDANVRHGEKLKDGGFRVWARREDHSAFRLSGTGADAEDPWNATRGGFRMDRTVCKGRELTVIGNAYAAGEETLFRAVVPTPPFFRVVPIGENATGGSLEARLVGAGSPDRDWSLQMYAQGNTHQEALLAGSNEVLDLEYQRRLRTGHDELVFGFDYRDINTNVNNTSPFVAFFPAARHTYIAAAFAQKRWNAKDDRWMVSLATRLESNSFTGLEVQPSLRGAVYPSKRTMGWAAISRAVRIPAPSQLDTVGNVVALPPGTLAPGTPETIVRLTGNKDLTAESDVDGEVGARWLVSDRLHLDLTAFHGYFHDLIRAAQNGPATIVSRVPPVAQVPVMPFNRGVATTDGVELAVNYAPRPDWRLTAGLANATFRPSIQAQGDNEAPGRLPRHSAHVTAEWDLSKRWELDTTTYYSDSLPTFGIPHWFRTDVHVGWTAPSGTRFELVGQNLLEKRHVEFGTEVIGGAVPELVPRSFYARVSRAF